MNAVRIRSICPSPSSASEFESMNAKADSILGLTSPVLTTFVTFSEVMLEKATFFSSWSFYKYCLRKLSLIVLHC